MLFEVRCVRWPIYPVRVWLMKSLGVTAASPSLIVGNVSRRGRGCRFNSMDGWTGNRRAAEIQIACSITAGPPATHFPTEFKTMADCGTLAWSRSINAVVFKDCWSHLNRANRERFLKVTVMLIEVSFRVIWTLITWAQIIWKNNNNSETF